MPWFVFLLAVNEWKSIYSQSRFLKAKESYGGVCVIFTCVIQTFWEKSIFLMSQILFILSHHFLFHVNEMWSHMKILQIINISRLFSGLNLTNGILKSISGINNFAIGPKIGKIYTREN